MMPNAAASRPWLSHGEICVLGTGRALPGPSLSSNALIDKMTTGFGLANRPKALAIARHMKINSRHVCRDFAHRSECARAGHSNPELAADAVSAALSAAGLEIGDTGYLIGHTTTPIQPLPSNISRVADLLGYSGPHAEFRQACTGFANALAMAFGLLAAPGARPVVIVGSETGSLFFDPARASEDEGQLVNLVQMGDGAGAIVLGPAMAGKNAIRAAWCGSIGLGRKPGLQMRHGAQDFEHDFSSILASGSLLFDADKRALELHGLTLEMADTIIPHQASGRIGEQLAQYFGIASDRLFVNTDHVGNTGSAAIWLAFDELRAGGLASGTRVVAFGAEATKYMYGGFVYEHG